MKAGFEKRAKDQVAGPRHYKTITKQRKKRLFKRNLKGQSYTH